VNEREGDAGKIAPATAAAKNDVRFLAGQLHLLDAFLADDRLVQADVIQHAAERVFRVRVRNGIFDGLTDGDTEAAGAVRIFSQHFAPEFSQVAGLECTVAPQVCMSIRR